MTNIKFLVIIIILIVVLWAGGLIFAVSFFNDWEQRGQFGDLFGSVNSLFSGLAFAGLIYTIFLQHRELALQREELKLQREEMAKSREELAEQAEIQRAQFYSSIAQLRAIAGQYRVEATKILSLQKVEHARSEFAKEIVSEANKLEKIANDLEAMLGNS